LAFYIPR